jgi:hypothetical protein
MSINLKETGVRQPFVTHIPTENSNPVPENEIDKEQRRKLQVND